MIKGAYELHLPVRNLEKAITFYKKLGLELAWQTDTICFFWLEKNKTWLGLWENEEAVQTSYHPSLRHIAFRVDYNDFDNIFDWLRLRGIEPNDHPDTENGEPVVRPYQGNASVYFYDLDGNSLEMMCTLPSIDPSGKKMTFSQWKKKYHK